MTTVGVDTSITTGISTHTLTWSVTRVSTNLSYSYLYFNSHAHVERDENVVDMGKQILDFNSHAHVERDI